MDCTLEMYVKRLIGHERTRQRDHVGSVWEWIQKVCEGVLWTLRHLCTRWAHCVHACTAVSLADQQWVQWLASMWSVCRWSACTWSVCRWSVCRWSVCACNDGCIKVYIWDCQFRTLRLIPGSCIQRRIHDDVYREKYKSTTKVRYTQKTLTSVWTRVIILYKGCSVIPRRYIYIENCTWTFVSLNGGEC